MKYIHINTGTMVESGVELDSAIYMLVEPEGNTASSNMEKPTKSKKQVSK